MKLEEAIKQTKPFPCLYQKALVNIFYTNNWLSSRLKYALKEYNITPKQYNILRILNGAKRPVSNAYLRERLLDKVSDVSRIVDRMEHKGLISKCTSTTDKRLVDISIQQKGVILLEQIMSTINSNQEILSNLSEEEVTQLNNLLDKIRS